MYTYAALFVMLASSWMLVVFVPAPLFGIISVSCQAKSKPVNRLWDGADGFTRRSKSDEEALEMSELRFLESGFREPLP